MESIRQGSNITVSMQVRITIDAPKVSFKFVNRRCFQCSQFMDAFDIVLSIWATIAYMQMIHARALV